MSGTDLKEIEEILRAIAGGDEFTAIQKLAKAGGDARERKALEHMEKALELYRQAQEETKFARFCLSLEYIDVQVLCALHEPDANEMILRVTAARDFLLGRDGPALRRRAKREKAEETDSSLRSE